MRRGRRAALTIAFALLPSVASAAIVRVGPTDGWCAAINAARPGDEVLLAPGMYTTPCSITASGTAASPVVVRSADESAGQRATFAYTGTSSNVLDLRSVAFVTLRALSFPRTADGVDAIKLHSSRDVVIEQCDFRDVGGIAVSVLDGDCARVTVRDNTFRALRATAMYFGCQDGLACHATELRIERNLIDGVTASGGAVGYGLQIKLNSYGVVRDNTVYRTTGPCIMVYGSNRGDPASVIEGNYVDTSQTDGGLVVGGGPAIVRNNVAVRGTLGGIVVQDYGGRGLMRDIAIVFNTVLDNARAGIAVQNWVAGRNNVLAFNAIAPRAGSPMLLPAMPIGTVSDNVDCSAAASCFARATEPFDLRPATASPLLDRGGAGAEPWRPSDDFMGEPRGMAADVGAFERTGRMVDVSLGMGAARPARVGSGMSGDAGPQPDGAGGADVAAATDASGGVDGGVDGGVAVEGGDVGVNPDGGLSGAPRGCGCRTVPSARGIASFGWIAVAAAVTTVGVARRRAGRRCPGRRRV